MPRFPIVAQRSRAPAAFSNSPRAEAADFGGGLGEAVAEFGAGAAELGQVIKERRRLQAAREAKRVRDEAEAERLAEAAEQPESVTDIEREQQRFDDKAAGAEEAYKDHPLEDQVSLQMEEQRQSWNQRLVAFEARKRAKADLARADEIAGLWGERVMKDPAQFDAAVSDLLGDGTEHAGQLSGLGLRPEAQAAWTAQTFEKLLSAQMAGDPQALLSDLEAGRWRERLGEERHGPWLEDARDAVALREREQAGESRQRVAGEVLSLQRAITKGEAGRAEIRRAEREGRFSPEQLAGLKQEAERAEIAAQARAAADDELGIALTSGIDFNPGSPVSRKAAEDFYASTFRDAVRAGADDATQERVADAVAKTGYLPKGLAQDITAGLQGGDPDRQVAAAELYGRLLQTSPELLPKTLDPETQARGGILSRWLEAGLPTEEALQRAETEISAPFLEDEELGALQRDLRSRLAGSAASHVVGRLLDRLHEKYLSLLGQGLTPRAADAQIQKDLGTAFIRLDQMEARLAEAGFVATLRDGRPVLVSTQARLQKAAAPAVAAAGVAVGAVIAAAAVMSWSIQTAKGFGLEVSDEVEELNSLLSGLSEETRIYVFETLPEIAAWFDKAVVRLGDDVASLGQVLSENEHTDLRTVEIFRSDYGRMVLSQRYDRTTERYHNLDVTFWDPQAKKEVTERFPNSRFFVPADGVAGQTSGPLLPHPQGDVQPEGFKPHDSSDQPITTAGDPPSNSAMEDPPEGFIPIGPNGPVKTTFPDQSQDLKIPIFLLSEGGYRNAKKGDLSADGTFTWVEPGPIKTNTQLRKEWEDYYGNEWPIDPDTGKKQDVSHEEALADGGPANIFNIRPRTREDHIRRHKERGDFKRWQDRRRK